MTRLHDSEDVIGYIPPMTGRVRDVPRYQAEPEEQITPVRLILAILVALSLWVALAFLTMYIGAVS